jgi:predicted ATP-binding protein involved in virulence
VSNADRASVAGVSVPTYPQGMALQDVTVEDLFGEFTHHIGLNAKEGLTLLHGPNGVGKTTVLRLIDSLFSRRFSVLRRLPFGALSVTLTDGDRLQVVKRNVSDGPRQRPTALLEFITVPRNGRSKSWIFRPSQQQGNEIPLSLVDDFVPELTRTAQREWLDTTSGETLELEEVLDRYPERFPSVRHRPHADSPDWLEDFLSRVPVYSIEAQRLQSAPVKATPRVRRAGGTEGFAQLPTVVVFAEDLAEKIRRTLANYGDVSQSLDSTFPSRLLQVQAAQVLIASDEEIRSRYADQAKRRNRYVRAGLLDAGDELTLPDRELDGAERRVLAAYLNDVDSKLNQLDDLADKLELFLSIVNGKFRRKSIVVDRERGFRVMTSDNEHLELASLSSGEQQEMVLAYGLLFRETPGTLILLDEPELSLHVSWQLDLIPDLLKIAELTKLEFLVATHSPQIINDRWDLAVALGDGE